jgi:hypothetical protein
MPQQNVAETITVCGSGSQGRSGCSNSTVAAGVSTGEAGFDVAVEDPAMTWVSPVAAGGWVAGFAGEPQAVRIIKITKESQHFFKRTSLEPSRVGRRPLDPLYNQSQLHADYIFEEVV